MNIGKEYQRLKFMERLGIGAAISVILSILLFFVAIRFNSKGPAPPYLFVASVVGYVLFRCYYKTYKHNPLYNSITSINRWLELNLGTVDEFPLDTNIRRKLVESRWVDKALLVPLNNAFSFAEVREDYDNDIKKVQADLKKLEDAQEISSPAEIQGYQTAEAGLRAKLADLQEGFDFHNGRAQIWFETFNKHWDFFRNMKMLPMKPPQKPNGKPRPWKDATEYIKAKERERAAQKLAAGVPLTPADSATLAPGDISN